MQFNQIVSLYSKLLFELCISYNRMISKHSYDMLKIRLEKEIEIV